MQVVETKVYKFNELSTEAQEYVIEKVKNSSSYMDYDWYDGVTSPREGEESFAYRTCNDNGFTLDRVYFSGFWSQGDGTMFEGEVDHDVMMKLFIKEKGVSKWFAYIPLYGGKIKHKGRYYHENSKEISTVEVDCCKDNDNTKRITKLVDKYEEFIEEKYVNVCKATYKQLSKEYDYLTSDEAIREHLECQGADYEENGEEF